MRPETKTQTLNNLFMRMSLFLYKYNLWDASAFILWEYKTEHRDEKENINVLGYDIEQMNILSNVKL